MEYVSLTAEERKTAEELRIKCVVGLNAAGFCLFPLVPGQKEPACEWGSVTPGMYHERNLFGNYGIALKAGDLVIDVDPRNGGTVSWDKLTRDVPGVLGGLTFAVVTGGGGLHVFLSKSPDIKVRKHHKDYPGIDFLSSGCFIVGPGSIHPKSGKVYEPVNGTSPSSICQAEGLLVDILEKTFNDAPDANTHAPKTDKIAEDEGTQQLFITYLKTTAPLAISGSAGDDTTFKVCCHGRDLGLPENIVFELMRDNWNARCEPPWANSDLKDKVNHAYKYASGKIGAKHPGRDFADIPPLPDAKGTDTGHLELRKEYSALDWHCNKTDGKALKSLHNLLLYLRLPGHPLAKLFGYNEFTGQIEVTTPAPWHNGKMPVHPGIVDHDLILLKAFLSERYDFELPIAIIDEGVKAISYKNKFHPVREYLESLEWDGKPRLDTWLSDYAGVKNDPYTRACARKTLCAAVARVMNPGCKFDHILVVEGTQDSGKSRLCEALGGDWYGDFVIDPHNKDTIQNLQGKWIVEMSEMEVTRRSDVAALKAFITRRIDKARLAYLRLSAEFRRQSIFIGTINPEADNAWLKDDSGNRRFWPVEQHGIINVAGIKEVRNQLFAEAVVKFREGEPLFMESKVLKNLAAAEAGERHAEHSWTEAIVVWLCTLKPGERDFVTTREVFLEAMQGTDQKLDRRVTVSIATVMRARGWVKIVKNLPLRGSTRGYARPGTANAQGEMSVEEAAKMLGDLI